MQAGYYHTNAALQMGMRGVLKDGENLGEGENRGKQVQVSADH